MNELGGSKCETKLFEGDYIKMSVLNPIEFFFVL